MDIHRNPLFYSLSTVSQAILRSFIASEKTRVPRSDFDLIVDPMGIMGTEGLTKGLLALERIGFMVRTTERYRGSETDMVTLLPWDDSFKLHRVIEGVPWVPKQWSEEKYTGPDEHHWFRDPGNSKAINAEELELEIKMLFGLWLDVCGKDKSRTKLSPKRRGIIRRLLGENSAEDVSLAIKGMIYSDHHMGRTETNKVVYDDLKYVERNFDTFYQLGEANEIE